MATEKDISLIEFLLTSTEKGTISWEPTAQDEQFTTTFRGKYKTLLDRFNRGTCAVSLYNEADENLLTVDDDEIPQIKSPLRDGPS
jgi:hypothetical protein